MDDLRTHTGRTDIPLTAHGEDEARELAPRIREIALAHVLTSPLQRARRTCELLKLGGVAKIEPDLAEWDYGDYEGRRSAEIREGRPDWNLFRDGSPRSMELLRPPIRPGTQPGRGDTGLMQERAIQRWDNEGGEIPQRAERRDEEHAAREGLTA